MDNEKDKYLPPLEVAEAKIALSLLKYKVAILQAKAKGLLKED